MTFYRSDLYIEVEGLTKTVHWNKLTAVLMLRWSYYSSGLYKPVKLFLYRNSHELYQNCTDCYCTCILYQTNSQKCFLSYQCTGGCVRSFSFLEFRLLVLVCVYVRIQNLLPTECWLINSNPPNLLPIQTVILLFQEQGWT